MNSWVPKILYLFLTPHFNQKLPKILELVQSEEFPFTQVHFLVADIV